ncbi:uncharacterized protein [Palaemon carinicauda]|uniref:uncharacterized protein isoform X2 n=1 Tax=Palaemon carinicauda TaxID=392227 RepID=UPI0035B64909
MQGVKFVILLVALSSASACKYFCRKPGTFEYECCDAGNPYFPSEEVTPPEEGNTEQASESDAATEVAVADAVTDAVPESSLKIVTHPPSNCYYYCAYDGKVYCCGDASQPIPESHANHDGRCPSEEEQTCKSTGVYLISKKYQAKTSGAIRLASGPAKEQLTCASDGYCLEDEKCCPSHCGRKHICLKSLPEDDVQE